MATVYLARDLRHDRDVALKVLRPDLAATLGPERFLREIQIAARLQHPNILPVHDSGEAVGSLYYVMPFVEGLSLRERLSEHGELAVGEAIRILRDVADALAHAHAHGVLHRDIKPENIMLSGRHALVADFGVAKAVREATGRHNLTTVGVALGTPTYMAPEQAAADPHTDHRADIYAFGVTAYELLAGRPPFTGITAQAVLAAHLTEAPSPVSGLRPSLPQPLAQLVMRCLEKKPADRPQSAEELLQVLESLATPSGGVTPAYTQALKAPERKRRLAFGRAREEAGGEARRLSRAGRLLLGLGVVAGLALLGVVAWRVLWPPTEGPAPAQGPAAREPVVAVYPFDLIGSASERPFGSLLQQTLSDALGASGGIEIVSTSTLNSYLPKQLTLDSLAARLGIDYLVSGRATISETATQLTVYVLDRRGKQVAQPRTFSAGPAALESTEDLQYLTRKAADHVLQTVGARLRSETWLVGTRSPDAVYALHEANQLTAQAGPLLNRDNLAPARDLLDRADGLLAQAMTADPQWTTPAVRRAELAVSRAAANRDLGEAAVRARLAEGLAILGPLLARHPEDARAHAAHGKLLYQETVLLTLDPTARARAAAQARAELERALELDHTLAGAAAELAYMLYSDADFGGARVYAAQALDMDAYQEQADQLTYLLAMATFETGDDVGALRLCRGAFRRFDEDPMHHGCVLEVLAFGDSAPDIAEAWRHFERIRSLTARNPAIAAFYQTEVTAALARAGLRDSAQRVLTRARRDYAPQFRADVNLLWLEAAARFRMGQSDSATALLRAYERGNPANLRFTLSHRALRPYLADLLRDRPRT